MKKTYIKPSINVVEADTAALMAGSRPINGLYWNAGDDKGSINVLEETTGNDIKDDEIG